MFRDIRHTMWKGMGLGLAAAAAVLVLSASLASAKGKPPKPPKDDPPPPAYEVTDFGKGRATGINDWGDVVGTVQREPVAFSPDVAIIMALNSTPLYPTPGVIELPPPPGHVVSRASDINNARQVVGHSYDPDWGQHAVLWEVDAAGSVVSGPVDLQAGTEYWQSSAEAINERGEIAGHGVRDDSALPVVWRPDGAGGYQVVELPDGGVAVDINNGLDGDDVVQVVGHNYQQALLWEIDGSGNVVSGPIDLGTLSHGDQSGSAAINDKGQVVGTAGNESWLIDPMDMNGDGALEWFWDSDGDGINDLMVALAPGMHTWAHDINNAGQVVGKYEPNGRFWMADGFIWQDGVMTLLSELVPPEYDNWLLRAVRINGGGQIIGQARIVSKKSTRYTFFLLTPTP